MDGIPTGRGRLRVLRPGGAGPGSSPNTRRAEVAELADALHSGCSARQGVEVRVLSSAPDDPSNSRRVAIHCLAYGILYFAYADNASPSRRIYVISIPRNWACVTHAAVDFQRPESAMV